MEVPEGFTVHVGPGDKEYLVLLLQYMIPALDQAFAAYHHKADLNVLHAEREVCQIPYSISVPPFLSAPQDIYFGATIPLHLLIIFTYIVCPNY